MITGIRARLGWCLLVWRSVAWAQTDPPLLPALVPSTDSLQQPSLRTSRTYLYGALSGSYTTSTNWNGQDVHSHALAANILWRDTRDGGDRGHVHQVIADLGYLKSIDTVWVKHLDRLQLSFLWSVRGLRWRRSWSAALNTQFLPTIIASPGGPAGEMQEQRIGGPLNPFTLDAGHGAMYTFWEKSSANIAFATIRLAGSPKATTAAELVDARTMEDDKAYYFLTYGLSLAVLIDRSFGRHIQWLNDTRFFGSGLDRDHVSFQASNMVIIKLWKYLQLRLDTRLAYDPLLDHDLQFRQEVVTGFFYERNP